MTQTTQQPTKRHTQWSRGILLLLVALLVLFLGNFACAPRWCICQPNASLPKAKQQRPNVNPVVFVHGMGSNPNREFCHLRRYLLKAGYPAKHLHDIHYQPSKGELTIPEIVFQMHHQMNRIMRQYKRTQKRFDIVAMSMGTIVSRYWMQNKGGHLYVRRFIALSGPHRGSFWGIFGKLLPGLRRSRGIRQLRRNSPFLNTLNKGLNTLQDVEIYTVYTPHDKTVLPGRSGCLLQARNHVVNVKLHRCVPHDPKVMELVKTLLLSTKPPTLTNFRPPKQDQKLCPLVPKKPTQQPPAPSKRK